MEEIPVTRIYLESLTTPELVRMADLYGIDIPPDLDRIFIIEELLDVTSSDEPDFVSGEFALDSAPETAVSNLKESVPLPRQYNISFLEVMLRDPLWAFVFWEIKVSDKEQFEKAPEFGGYYLKVSPFDGPALPVPGEAGVFTVPVKPEDNAWYLSLVSVVGAGTSPGEQIRYKVELCAGMKGDETVIVVSKPFNFPEFSAGTEVPPPGKQAEGGGVKVNHLILLSGYEDFKVIRNSERTQRTKKSVSIGSYEQ